MEYGLWINGRWQAGSGTVDVENPATGKTVAQVATAGEQEVNAAVAAAKAAFDDGRWSKATPGERSGVLWKMADIIEARADELAKIETEDTGKPYEFISK
nr:aldehyde dehydrogenase family protein [Neisseria sp.]